MKPWHVVSCVLCLVCGAPSSNAQIDTALLEFYPLGLGDLWQYRDVSGTRYPNKQVVDIDTVLSNGAHYVVLGSPTPPYVFDRIDSGLRVQWYAPWAGDTCGGSFPQEASVYRLGEDSGAVWKDCFNWNGFLGRPLIRYAGIRLEFVFGQMREVMVFRHGYVNPEIGDTIWPTVDKLARGIGLIYREFWHELGRYEYLSGAIIGSDTFGVVVSVRGGSDVIPTNFTLHQNYPNPFNPSTTIQYDLPEQSHVWLTVYDVLGREVVTLVDQVQNAGRHEVGFRGNGLASGVYIARFVVVNGAGGQLYAKTMKLMLMK